MEIVRNQNLENGSFIYSVQKKELCQLIIGPDGINYYSNGVTSVSSCDLEFPGDSSKFMYQKYEYDKLYLNFKANSNGYGISADYFKTGTQKGYWFYGSDFNIKSDQRRCEFTSQGISRKDLENFYNQFESLYIVNTMGALLYAKVNGEVKLEKKDKPILPTEKEICLLDREERTRNHYILLCSSPFNQRYKNESHKKNLNELRNIEDIENLKLFGPSLPLVNSSHILIGVKNGEFQLYWFNLIFKKNDYIPKKLSENVYKRELDEFTLELAPIKIIVPNYDEEIEKYNKENKQEEGPTKLKTYQEGK